MLPPPVYLDDDLPLRDGGNGATAYAEAVGVYLAFAVDRLAMTAGNNLVRWNPVEAEGATLLSKASLSNDLGLRRAKFLRNGSWEH